MKFLGEAITLASLVFLVSVTKVTGELGNITVEGDEGDKAYAIRDIEGDKFAFTTVQNNNDFPVNLTVTYNNCTITHEEIGEGTEMMIPVNRSLLSGSSYLTYTIDDGKGNTFIRQLHIILDPNLGLLNVSTLPKTLAVGTTYQVEATVKVGSSLTFSFHLDYLSYPEETIVLEVVKPCDETTKEATYTLRPDKEGNYTLEVIAFMDNQFLQFFLVFEALNPIPDLSAEFVGEALTRQETVYQKEEVEIVLKNTSSTASGSSYISTCIVMWGDGYWDNSGNVNRTVGEDDVSYHNKYAYSNNGTYNITIICSNAISSTSNTLSLDVINPITQTSAALERDLIPLSKEPADQEEAVVKIINADLSRDYKHLLVSVDFDNGLGDNFTIAQHGMEFSKCYLKRGDKVIYVTFKAFGLKKEMTFNLRIGLIDFYHSLGKAAVTVGENQVFKIVRYNLTRTLHVDVDMKPRTSKRTFQIGVDTIELTENFSNIGMKKLEAEVVYGSSLTEVAYIDIEVNDGCISPINLFESSYGLESTAMRADLSAIPTVAGRGKKSEQCDSDGALLFHWHVWKNTGQPPTYVWEILLIVQPNASNLVLNNYISLPGLYKIELRLTVSDIYQVNETTYLSVSPTPIITNIAGSVFKQVAVGNTIDMDAASVSVAPVVDEPDQGELTFTWKCYRLASGDDIARYTYPYVTSESFENLPDCPFGSLLDRGLISVETSNTTVSLGDLILFLVNGSSEDGRSDIATSVVEMVEIQPPNLIIECRWNCQDKFLIDERTVYITKIECASCTNAEIYGATYSWSLHEFDPGNNNNVEIPANMWSARITSDPSSSSFDSEGGWWEEGHSYTLTVTVQIGSYPEAKASKVIYPNVRPYDGTCDVKPIEGRAIDTEFQFFFQNWKDEGRRPYRDQILDVDSSLLYEVQQKASIATPVSYFGAEISTPKLMLPACGTGNDFCNVDVMIIDVYRARSLCSVRIKVENYSPIPSNATREEQEQIMYDVIEDMNEKLQSAFDRGDPVKIVQDAAIYASVIISLDNVIEEDDEFTTFAVANMSSDEGLPPLLDAETVLKPVQIALTEAADNYVNTMSLALDMVIERNDVEDPTQVEIFAKAMTTATSSKTLLSGTAMEIASRDAVKLGTLLSDQAPNLRTMGELKDSLSGLVNNLIEAAAFDPQTYEPDPSQLGTQSGLSDNEVTYVSELLAKRRSFTDREKLQRAPQVVQNIRKSWDSMLNVMRQVEYSDGRYQTSRSGFSAVVQRTTRHDVLQEIKSTGEMSPINGFSFSDVEMGTRTDFESIDVQAVKSKNIFTYGKHSKFITSDIYVASVVTDDGTKLKVIQPKITHQVTDLCSLDMDRRNLITPKFVQEDAAHLFYHSFEYVDLNAIVCISVKHTDPSIFYRLYLKAGSEPSDVGYDHRETIPLRKLQGCDEICVPKGTLRKNGLAFIGLRPFEDKTVTRSRKKRQAVIDPLLAPYFFGVTSVACYTWDEQEVDWVASRCKIDKSNGTVTCTCEDTTELINGISFNISPNTIHFGTVFSKFDVTAQGAVLGVLIGILFLFALSCVWAHYMDRKGVFQWGVFPLVDNYAEDDYYYLITVHTGLRRSAGTKSKVSFSLAGELDETGVRKMSDGVREGFPTGSVVHFVMACPSTLGSLQCIRLWHDNSGVRKEASWYLDRMDIVDLQTGHAYHFICGEWLTPENNTVDKVIEASSVQDLQTLKSLFFTHTRKHITDEHIWVSVFVRPERSRFSRVERLGCCLAFFFLALITSAMFYSGAPDNDRQQPESDLEIGPVRLSFQQLYYSFAAAIISSIPIIILVLLFKKARSMSEEDGGSCCRRRNKQTEQKDDNVIEKEMEEIWGVLDSEVKESGIDEKQLEEGKTTVTGKTDETGDKDKNRGEKQKTSCCARLPWMIRLERQLLELDKILMIKPDSEEMKETWPHAWRYVAWMLVSATVVVCSFFVILYSMEWGQDVTEEWLSTFFLSFLQSMCVVDPFKVIMLSIMMSIFIRKVNVKGVDKLDLRVISEINKDHGIKNKPNPSRQYISYHSPLSDEQLKKATMRRKIHIMIQNTLRELAVHFVFIMVVSSLCYTNRSKNDFQIHQRISADLVEPKYMGFEYVNTTDDYFAWLENVVTPWLFPETDASGRSIVSEDRQYTAVWDLYRLGAPRLRQSRMTKGSCITDQVEFRDCILRYNIDEEETREFCMGWQDTPCPQIDQLRVTAGAWYFRTARSIWGIPVAGNYEIYGGGGYIVNLDINVMIARAILEEMKESKWIDRQTRAVFLEFTVYCPNVNRFAYVILLAEFPETGGILKFVSIYPFTVHDPPGALGVFMSIMEIIGITFTVVGTVYVIFIFTKEKRAALKDFWFMLDVIAVIVAMITIAMFSMRLTTVNEAMEKMREDKTQFINYQQVIVWDTGFTLCLAVLVTISCIRLLKLAGYSEITMKVYYVLKLAAGTMPSFIMYVFLILVSFAFMGHILFGRTSIHFAGFLSCLETLFTGLMGHSGFKETNLPETENWKTILFFCFFVVIVVLFLTNIFLAVLFDLLTVGAHNDCEAVKSDKAKIFMVLWDSFLHTFGRQRDPMDRLEGKEKSEGTAVKKNPESGGLAVEKSLETWLERLGENMLRRFDEQESALLILGKNRDNPQNDGNSSDNLQRGSLNKVSPVYAGGTHTPLTDGPQHKDKGNEQ